MEGFKKKIGIRTQLYDPRQLFGRSKYSPLNSANLSLISEVTLPRTVNTSPPVAQTRVISCPRFTTY